VIALLQRVREARVEVGGSDIGRIGRGLLVFTGFEPDDETDTVTRMLERLLNYRVFADANDRMNLSLRETGGGLLLVPQFTLAADTRKGRRPSFTSAAHPDAGRRLFDRLVNEARQVHDEVATGQFGADMQVYLQNDGPVTFILNSEK
jgi:D-tyrosyl-tRNA(Tyr) deacylase